MNFKNCIAVLVLFISQISFSQEGIAVYSDYLSDNYYLLHPSMAGAANCTKLRFSARQQWSGQEDSPSLQTLTFNGRIGEKSGAGLVAYADRNGYSSQKGIKLSYAYHLMFSRDEVELNQLSFGVNVNFVQSSLDETDFLNSGDYDPIVDGTIVQQDSNFNMDIGMSYNYLDFYTHFTVRNAIESKNDIYTEFEDNNIRNFIINSGYVFGDSERVMLEPSIMYQYSDATKESSIDVNLKAYKQFEFGLLWGGLSYRRSFDGAEYVDDNGSIGTQYLQYITPIVGINYKQFMFAYTYTYLSGPVKFDTAGYNLITLGMNLWCKKERYHCNCPAIN
jgi:type IX secretion system PorP/SprF family membrane protein